MGKYNGAVITTAGQNLIAQAIAESKIVTFTTAQASSYAYPSSTNFEALTALTDVEKTVNINYAGVYSDTIVQASARFDNNGVETAYLINTLGFFAQLGTDTPILFAVSTAVTPDQMPVFDADNPSAFIYNMQMTVQNASSIELSVNPAGAVTVEQLNDVINVIETNIGDLSDLETDDKSSLVNAVNEVKSYAGTIQGLVVDAIYPVGSLYMSINNTMPSALTTGKTWELLSGNYVLKTISSGTGGQTSTAGNTGSTTLTAAQSGIPAHNHGLNSHTHTVGAHSHGLNGHTHTVGAHSHGLNNHTHSIPALSGTAASAGNHIHQVVRETDKWNTSGVGLYLSRAAVHNPLIAEDYWLQKNDVGEPNVCASSTSGAHTHSVTTNTSTTGAASGNTANSSVFNTGAASGSTANSSVFNTGAASGNTANNTATNASQGHTHTAGMPQNIGVYVWKRIA